MRIDPLNPLAKPEPSVSLKPARQKRGTRSAKTPASKVTLSDVRVTLAKKALQSPDANIAKIVSQIPLATFACLLKCDKAFAAISRDKFIAYCAEHPEHRDWRAAWAAFQKPRVIIPFVPVIQSAADAAKFIDAL